MMCTISSALVPKRSTLLAELARFYSILIFPFLAFRRLSPAFSDGTRLRAPLVGGLRRYLIGGRSEQEWELSLLGRI